MTPRPFLLLPVLCGIGAAQSLRNLGDMAGFWGVFWGALACVGFGVVVAFMVGWSQVEVTEGRKSE